MVSKKNSTFSKDLSIVALSVLIAVIMVKTKLLSGILLHTKDFEFIGSFIAGLFFTSIFTTAPAIVALGEMASVGSVFMTAFFGAIGAVIGDLIIFRFVRDNLSEHFYSIVGREKWWKKIRFIFRMKYFRWITFFIGGLIIASPLPDELSVGLLGFSKINTKQFIPISFIFNFIGILAIGLVAKSL